jgi:hypothetical protein
MNHLNFGNNFIQDSMRLHHGGCEQIGQLDFGSDNISLAGHACSGMAWANPVLPQASLYWKLANGCSSFLQKNDSITTKCA